MDILVAFQIIADPDKLDEQDWVTGCENGRLDFSYIKKAVNSCDESALELACRFRDMSEEEVTLSAVTIGDKTADSVLKTLIALGYDEAVRLSTDSLPDQDTITSEYVAEAIACQVRNHGGYDLILTGRQSGDWNMGTAPLQLADRLGYLCLTNVTGIDADSDCIARVTWETDDEVCTAGITGPAVLAIGLASGTYLRVPTLKQRLATKQKGIGTIDITELMGLKPHEQYVLLKKMTPVIEKRDPVIIEGDDPAAAAETLHKYYREWMNE